MTSGGGGQYPYPKHVWTPSGGWWTRPHNWVANTAIATAGIAALTYGVWQHSAKVEQRHAEPVKWIPSIGPENSKKGNWVLKTRTLEIILSYDYANQSIFLDALALCVCVSVRGGSARRLGDSDRPRKRTT
ncbi:hypothetical protein AG1IA_03023 [Rhizoctonia solani AG-1 IA]|uniref:Uncharacterized protein n=1 Tax=Thanatephorus cucumeris (strain AG1-IA) TaxID=983506 RepID=L8WY61_THACA|nr:hypothetical protein AG1IA_03023 [Rhizoctonia solani AG-1 IA]